MITVQQFRQDLIQGGIHADQIEEAVQQYADVRELWKRSQSKPKSFEKYAICEKCKHYRLCCGKCKATGKEVFVATLSECPHGIW